MDNNDLKKLNRKQLLEMLLKQTVRVEELENQLHEMKLKLDDKTIAQQEIGSIAEASLKLNGVFEAAEAAAAQYIDSVRRLSNAPDMDQTVMKMFEEKERSCKRREAEADRKIREASMKIAEAERVMAAVKKALQKVVAAEQPEDAVERLFFSILGK